MTVRALVGRTLRLALPLYLTTLLLGAVPTTVAMYGFWLLAGDRPWRGDLLGPDWLNLAAEVVLTAIRGGGSAGTALIWLSLSLLLPLALLAQVIAYSFLAGGILEALREPGAATPGAASGTTSGLTSASLVSARDAFLRACRRWFWPNFRLSLLGASLFLATLLLGAVLAALVDGVVGPNVAFVLQFALQAVVWGWIEAARAAMVAEGKRSVGAALWRGLRVAARPLSLVAWLLLALPSSGLLLAAIMSPAPADAASLGGLLTALLYGQGVALLGAWTRVVRLAVALRLVAGVRVPALSPPAAVSRG
jgi:hypothetical protein